MSSEIYILLDIVGDVQLLGANEWAVVAVRFNDGTEELPVNRDENSLGKKFDKVVPMKKKTGYPSCLPHFCLEKHIACDICGWLSTEVVDDSLEDNEGEEVGSLVDDGSAPESNGDGGLS